MNKKDLEQLKNMLLELEHLENELKNSPLTVDSVKGSDIEFPYICHNIKITGIDETAAKRTRRRIEIQKYKLEAKISEMEDWLDTIDDSLTRDILRLTYRNGLTQKQIGDELKYDQSVISRKLKYFWKK